MDIYLAQRLLCAFMSGSLLSLSGSLIQAVTQNQLAGPSTIGLDAAIVVVILCAHLALTFGGNFASLEITALVFFLGLFFCVAWFILGRTSASKHYRGNSSSITFFLLAGLCFNLFVGSLFALMQFLFLNLNWEFPHQLWFGNFRQVTWPIVILESFFFIIIFTILTSLQRALRWIGFGTELALNIGIPVEMIQRRALLMAFLAVGVVSAFFGIFAFAGLILPLLLRQLPFFRFNLSRELFWGAWLSGVVFSCLDFLCWEFPFFGAEIPAGLITSFLGGLFLIIYFLKKRVTSLA